MDASVSTGNITWRGCEPARLATNLGMHLHEALCLACKANMGTTLTYQRFTCLFMHACKDFACWCSFCMCKAAVRCESAVSPLWFDLKNTSNCTANSNSIRKTSVSSLFHSRLIMASARQLQQIPFVVVLSCLASVGERQCNKLFDALDQASVV